MYDSVDILLSVDVILVSSWSGTNEGEDLILSLGIVTQCVESQESLCTQHASQILKEVSLQEFARRSQHQVRLFIVDVHNDDVELRTAVSVHEIVSISNY